MSDAQATRPIAIRAEPSAFDPDACRFVVDRPVASGQDIWFRNAADADGSPLPARLLALPGVANVHVAENVVTVAKTTQSQWTELLVPIGQAIREQLLSGVSPIGDGKAHARLTAKNDEDIDRILRNLLEREINPQIAGHHGKISLERVENRTAYVRFEGGCQGCAASSVTLRHGVEVIVHRVLPDVRILDATDHASGKRPFLKCCRREPTAPYFFCVPSDSLRAAIMGTGPIDNQVAIDRLAVRGSPEHEILERADHAGDRNQRVGVDELVGALKDPAAAKRLSPDQVNALQARLLNTLAPEAGRPLTANRYMAPLTLPMHVTLKERSGFTWTGGENVPAYDVVNENGTAVAAIERRIEQGSLGDAVRNNFAPTLVLVDPARQDPKLRIAAVAKPHVFNRNHPGDSLRSAIVVTDAQGHKIGTIRECWDGVGKRFLEQITTAKAYSTFVEILDANDQVVARTNNGQRLSTSLDVSVDGHAIGNVSRGFWQSRLGGKWDIKVRDPNQIDRRLLVFVAAYRPYTDRVSVEIDTDEGKKMRR